MNRLSSDLFLSGADWYQVEVVPHEKRSTEFLSVVQGIARKYGPYTTQTTDIRKGRTPAESLFLLFSTEDAAVNFKRELALNGQVVNEAWVRPIEPGKTVRTYELMQHPN